MSPSIHTRENREFATEIKFLIDPAAAGKILDWARANLAPDPQAGGDSLDTYQITSLYFDTEQYDVFHRRGSFGRSKYRIRRYDLGEVAFLERKLKTRGFLTKRRTIVKLGELERLSEPGSGRDWAGHWFHQRLLARQLRPVCQITYRRTARVAMTNHGPIRLTMDERICARPATGLAFNDAGESTALSESRIILELKYRVEMPALFRPMVESFELTPQPVSKYRLAAAALGLVADFAPPPETSAPSVPTLCALG